MNAGDTVNVFVLCFRFASRGTEIALMKNACKDFKLNAEKGGALL